jgi:hypothetical protein
VKNSKNEQTLPASVASGEGWVEKLEQTEYFKGR